MPKIFKDISSTALGQGERGIEGLAEDINRHALLISLVGAYSLLKIDLGDVSSAVTKITSAVGKIAVS